MAKDNPAQPTQPKASGAGQPQQAGQQQAIQQISDEVTRLEQQAGGTPQGAGAGLGGNLGRFLPQLLPPLLEIAGMAQGGLDPDEAKRIAQIVWDTVQRLRSGG